MYCTIICVELERLLLVSGGLEQQESPRREMRRASHPSDLNSRPPGTADTTGKPR